MQAGISSGRFRAGRRSHELRVAAQLQGVPLDHAEQASPESLPSSGATGEVAAELGEVGTDVSSVKMRTLSRMRVTRLGKICSSTSSVSEESRSPISW